MAVVHFGAAGSDRIAWATPGSGGSAWRLNLVRPDVDVRFLYYVSDVPLDPSSNLSGRLAPGEGIPPLYGVTRVILDEVLRTM